jgi:hypothetical protein
LMPGPGPAVMINLGEFLDFTFSPCSGRLNENSLLAVRATHPPQSAWPREVPRVVEIRLLVLALGAHTSHAVAVARKEQVGESERE